jgi:hypothetical protein
MSQTAFLSPSPAPSWPPPDGGYCAIFIVVTAVFHIAGLRSSPWVYACALMALTFVAGLVLRRRGRNDADLVQAVSYYIDATIVTVACAMIGGGCGSRSQ